MEITHLAKYRLNFHEADLKIKCLAQRHNTMPFLRLESATPGPIFMLNSTQLSTKFQLDITKIQKK